jgi:hypothetical protein
VRTTSFEGHEPSAHPTRRRRSDARSPINSEEPECHAGAGEFQEQDAEKVRRGRRRTDGAVHRSEHSGGQTRGNLALQKINNKWVLYGLGNTIAAQETPVEGTRRGLLVRVTFSQDRAGGWSTSDVAWVPSLQNPDPPHQWCSLTAGVICLAPTWTRPRWPPPPRRSTSTTPTAPAPTRWTIPEIVAGSDH